MKKNQYIMILAVIFWAGAFIAGKFTANIINPVTITFLRFLIASIVIDSYLILMKIDLKISRALLKESLILAVVGMIGYHVLFYTALQYTSAIHSSLIASMNPFFTYILSIMFLGNKAKLNKFAYILLALFSVSMILLNWNFNVLFNNGVNPGDLYMILAVLLWASYSILVKIFIVKYEPIVLTATVFNITVFLLIPFANYNQVMQLFTNDTAVIFSMFYMGIFPTVFGYLIQQYSIKSIGPDKTNIFINLVPVFAIVLSVLILHENINILNLLSGIIVIGSVYKFNTAR
ncbi:MAG: DMT family transporter [Clostridiales bacterium]|nr:DMT family transporter [Clostridiales bacterium]